jgi:pyridoxal 5'-phosphate synthase pdxT subunit
LRKLEIAALPIRLLAQLKGIDGLIIPGGESTTLLKLMNTFDMFNALRELAQSGFPIWGTCAGMICLGKNHSRSGEQSLAVMDITVKRNAFGRQIDSFETDLEIPALGNGPFKAIFIRAPAILKAGPEVEVLARLPDGTIVAARQLNLLVSAFHPELSDDLRFHQYFIKELLTRALRPFKSPYVKP